MGQRILAMDRPGTGLVVSSTRAMPATDAVVATCCKNSLMSSVPLSRVVRSKASLGAALPYSTRTAKCAAISAMRRVLH